LEGKPGGKTQRAGQKGTWAQQKTCAGAVLSSAEGGKAETGSIRAKWGFEVRAWNLVVTAKAREVVWEEKGMLVQKKHKWKNDNVIGEKGKKTKKKGK